MSRIFPIAAVAIACSLMAPSSSFAVLYNATSEFSISNGNPNSVWSYGYLNSAGAGFTLYNSGGDTNQGWTSSWHTNANLDAWSQFTYDSSSYSVVGINPSGSIQNETGGGSIAVDPGTLFTHPGNSGEKGTIRWTSPGIGSVVINAVFSASDTIGGDRDVHVYLGGADQIPGSSVVGSKSSATPVSYTSLSLPVIAGTTIDFAVGYGSDAVYFNDATALSNVTVNFNPIPEPGSLALLACGAIGMFLFRRKL